MNKILFLFIIPLLSFGQKINYTNTKNLQFFDYSGKLIDAYTWFDALGKNTLIISKKEGIVTNYSGSPSEQKENVIKKIYAYHYVGNYKNNIELLWDMKDYSDLEIYYDDILISDWDYDGVAETCIIYKKRTMSFDSYYIEEINDWHETMGDAAEVKLIMHEAKKKYAIRGKLKDNGDECVGLEYNMYGKNSFSDAPDIFKLNAKNLFFKNSWDCKESDSFPSK
tara:strand:- start:540 stop:1211 length:672 start_codon:yes stop_codon:yes gene_type:complete